MSSIGILSKCPLCRKQYDTAFSQHQDEPEALRLPVSCTSCCHTFCMECLKRLKMSEEYKDATIFPCPECGHCSSFDFENPFINRFACELLQAQAGLPGQENDEEKKEDNSLDKSLSSVRARRKKQKVLGAEATSEDSDCKVPAANLAPAKKKRAVEIDLTELESDSSAD